MPVVLADPVSGAVAGVHAGWRARSCGLSGRRHARSLRTQAPLLRGSRPSLGPSIRSCCFEVGPEVVSAFTEDRHDIGRIAAWPDAKARLSRGRTSSRAGAREAPRTARCGTAGGGGRGHRALHPVPSGVSLLPPRVRNRRQPELVRGGGGIGFGCGPIALRAALGVQEPPNRIKRLAARVGYGLRHHSWGGPIRRAPRQTGQFRLAGTRGLVT